MLLCFCWCTINLFLNRKVDFEIIKILKQRYFRCSFFERAVNEWYDLDKICLKEKDDLKKAELNLFIKCKCSWKQHSSAVANY